MTNVDQAEIIAITIHSRAATDTEILMTGFIACYLTEDIAWQYDSDHQKALTGARGEKRQRITNLDSSHLCEDWLLVRYMPHRQPILTSTNTDPARLYTWTRH
jgi:hypothetical protein